MAGTSIAAAIRDTLAIAEPRAFVFASRAVARDWRLGRIDWRHDVMLADEPARPAEPVLLAPRAMPKRGSGSLAGRVAMLHALAHIEYVAIALALDMAGRFGGAFPRSFTDDWLSVAADEAMHHALLDRRLRQLASHYGALPAHDGLWQAARATAHDPLARLAIVPMVFEARGLDVTPATVDRFRSQGDEASARIVERIYHDEIRHVAVGTRWFEFGCERLGVESTQHWKMLVNNGFRRAVQPPFNDSARRRAGLTQDYYSAVASLTSVAH